MYGCSTRSSSWAEIRVSNNASDATNDIDIAVGAVRSVDNADDIILSAALTKQLDAVWAVGTNAGMRAPGAAIANGTYHIFIIKRPDTGVVDVAMYTEEVGVSPVADGGAAAYRERVRDLVAGGRAYAKFVAGQVVFKAELAVITRHTAQHQKRLQANFSSSRGCLAA